MKFKTYGKPEHDSIFLIHDLGLNPLQYEKTAELLSRKYFVVLPELDGHGTSAIPFESIRSQSRQILAYIDKNRQGQVMLVGGSGLGAMIALDILSQRIFTASHALLDGLALHENLSLLPLKLSRRYTALKRNPKMLGEVISRPDKETLTAAIQEMKNFDMPSLTGLRTKVLITYGENTSRSTKKTATQLFRTIDDSSLEEMEGMSHGDLTIENPHKLAILLFKLISSLS